MTPRRDDPDDAGRLSRRAALARAGGLAAIVLGTSALPAEASASGSQSALACLLSPEMTEGPYYLAGEKVRRNITEAAAHC
jgi:hypothetical protein